MVNHINCFTIAAGAPLVAGIPIRPGITTERTGQKVQVLLAHTVPVTLGGDAGMPELSRDQRFVLRARGHVLDGRYSLIAQGHLIDRIMVRVLCRNLKFGFEPLAPQLNLWPGGDGEVQPFAQAGRHKNDPAKDQLFEIQRHYSILVVDEAGAVVKLSYENARPSIAPLSLEELVSFLMRRVEARSTVPAIDWAYHNLIILRDTMGTNEPVITSALDRIEQLRRKR
jgi:hypothetical protein